MLTPTIPAVCCPHPVAAAAVTGWWFKPDFIINELNINSAVSRPWHDEVLPLGTNSVYKMNGYAYTGTVLAVRDLWQGFPGVFCVVLGCFSQTACRQHTCTSGGLRTAEAAWLLRTAACLVCELLCPLLTSPLRAYARMPLQVVAARSSVWRCLWMVDTSGARRRSHAIRHQHQQVNRAPG
jgi:hypothetical protein